MPAQPDYRDEAEQLLIPSLRGMLERARQSGARFAVASFACPDLYNLPAVEQAWFRSQFFFKQVVRAEFDDYVSATNGFNDSVRAFCEREGALYIPVAENLKGGFALYVDITHMHIAGMRLKAQIMFEHLKEAISKDWETVARTSSPPT